MKRVGRCVGIGLFVLLAMLLLIPGAKMTQAKKKYISQKEAYLAKGDTLQLKVKNVSASKVKWKSSKKKVATVSSNGKVKAKKTGKATITARVGKKKYTCKVIVEKKAVNQARRLRDYVLDKGKADKDSGLIVWEKRTYDESSGESDVLSVGASEKDMKLTFHWYHAPEYPYDRYEFTMTIDLINGKASERTGDITYRYYNQDEPFEYRYEGVVYAFEDEDAEYSSAITRYGTLEESGGYPIKMNDVDSMSYNDENETLCFRMRDAFDDWDKWFKKVKALKKYNISMKSIGFEWR